jgi:hypothetical protein
MLSWSIEEAGSQVNLAAINDSGVDPMVLGGRPLLDYVSAILSGEGVEETRDRVADTLGATATVNAAAVTGNFEMMNRIADGVGMPVGRRRRTQMKAEIEALGLDRFPHA